MITIVDTDGCTFHVNPESIQYIEESQEYFTISFKNGIILAPLSDLQWFLLEIKKQKRRKS